MARYKPTHAKNKHGRKAAQQPVRNAAPQHAHARAPKQNHLRNAAPQPPKRPLLVRMVRGFAASLCVALLCANLFLVLASACNLKEYFNWVPVALLEVTSDSMSPMFATGDAVLVRQTDYDTLAVGDVVTFYENGTLVTHKIIAQEGENFTTIGIANLVEDPNLLTADTYAAKVVAVLPCVGYLMAFTANAAQMGALVLLVCLLLYANQIARGVRAFCAAPRRTTKAAAQCMAAAFGKASALKGTACLAACSLLLCTHYVTVAKYVATINQHTIISAAYVHFNANYLSETGNTYVINVWDGDSSGEEDALSLVVRGISNDLLYNTKSPMVDINGNVITQQVTTTTTDGTTTTTETVYAETQDLYYYIIVEKQDDVIEGTDTSYTTTNAETGVSTTTERSSDYMVPLSEYTITLDPADTVAAISLSAAAASDTTTEEDAFLPQLSEEWVTRIWVNDNTVSAEDPTTYKITKDGEAAADGDAYAVYGPYLLPAAIYYDDASEDAAVQQAITEAKTALNHALNIEIKLDNPENADYYYQFVCFNVYAVTSANDQFYSALMGTFQYKRSDDSEFISAEHVEESGTLVTYTLSSNQTTTGDGVEYVLIKWDPDRYYINMAETTAFSVIYGENAEQYYSKDYGMIIVSMRGNSSLSLQFFEKDGATLTDGDFSYQVVAATDSVTDLYQDSQTNEGDTP